MSRPSIPIANRFWSKVDKRKGNSCWLWLASISKRGYGNVSKIMGGLRRNVGAHRVAWELINGPIPNGLCVLHKCDNPPCVRPSHLFLGTQADNMKDCGVKGRQPGSNGKCRGEMHIHHKLTWEKVREIRARKGEQARKLAWEYGVDESLIPRIWKNKVWKEAKA